MQVKIVFRGLILFRFPTTGPDANKLVAELITEPANRDWSKIRGAVQGQDDHESTIQVVTGENAQQLVPHTIDRNSRIEITIPGCRGGVQRLKSFNEHIPKIDTLARMAGLTKDSGVNPDDYLRATVVVDCGTVRAQNVITWDNGFPLPGANRGDTPATPAEVKFCGVAAAGHAANECVVEAEGDTVNINSPLISNIHRGHRAAGRRNQLAQEDTVEILVENFEYQRAKPVPWGLDFQWLFARLGWGVANLGTEVDGFKAGARAYDTELFAQDEASTLPGRDGRPFPYIVSNSSLVTLTPIMDLKTKSPLTAIKSRPLCVPGT